MFFPAEFSEYGYMYGTGIPVSSGTSYSGTTHSGTGSKYRYRTAGSLKFWFVVRLSGSDYADYLEEHPEIPMMIPTRGKLIGIARDQAELNRMTTDLQPDPTSNDPNRYVYLIYRIGMEGIEELLPALEFFHKHGMLERES